MKHTRLLILLALFFGLLPNAFSQSQIPTTQGKEFWVSFMKNGYRNNNYYDQLSLVISAKRGCRGTITNPNTGWSSSFEVGDHDIEMVYIPDDHAYNDQSDGISYTGLYVTSEDTISLYVGNEAQNSYDAANVLPVPALGSDYMIQTYESSGSGQSHGENNRASFLVVATEDQTVVDIVPTATTALGHQAGEPYYVTLKRGQCYHVMTQSSSINGNGAGDFSGTTVIARDEKKIAVFNGNSITSVPGGLTSGYDHIFEQAMPTDHWGKRFVVTSTRHPDYMALSEDYVKVTAYDDNTVVKRDGEDLFVLQSGESDGFWLDLDDNPCAFLEADKPVAVYLIQHSHGSGNPNYGDPSMVWISPVEQTIYEVTFSTFQVQEIEKHYVNIVCYSQDASSLTLDGQNIVLNFRPVPGNSEYSYARVEVQHGAHTLQSPRGFVAHVYGIGQAEGYAYSVGSSAKLLTKQMYINDELTSTLPDGYHTCQSESLQFRTEVNYDFTHIDWTFGDGGTANGPEVNHSYDGASDYNVSSVVYRIVEGIERPFDTLTAVVHVHPVQQGTPIVESTCGNTYTFNGQDYPVPYHGDIIMTSQYGCDSIVHLTVNEGEFSRDSVAVQACESYMWYDTLRTESGRYEHWVYDYNEDGCDSLYVLNLYVGHPSTTTVATVENCGIYYWNGLVCDTTGEYSYTFITESGCDSIVILSFTHVDVDPIHESMTACEPTQWFEHLMSESGDYEHLSHESSGCDTLHVMHFTLDDKIQEEYTLIECDEYEWYGTPYTQSGTYHHTVSGTNGCDSLLTLHLTLHQTPAFEKIDGLSNIAVASSYWPGTYNYYVDGTGVNPDSIHWELVDNPGWTITAQGASCQITATSMGTVELKVWTTGLDKCNKETSVLIHCGGFDIEENSINILNIFPNPAQSAITIACKSMKSVSLYDVMGQRLRRLEVEGMEEQSMGLDGLSAGLYMVEVVLVDGTVLQRPVMFQP